MFIPEKIEVLPTGFLDLKYDVTLCASHMFGTETRQNGDKKGINQGQYAKTLTTNQELQYQ